MSLFLLRELNEASVEHQDEQSYQKKVFHVFGVKERIFPHGVSSILSGEYFLMFANLKYSDTPLLKIISYTTFEDNYRNIVEFQLIEY